MAHAAHYVEAHPSVFRVTHWINLIAIVALAFSGFYIHYPFSGGLMPLARGMHFFFMWVLVINITFRIIAAFFVKTAQVNGTREVDTDLKNWWFQKANRHQLWPWIKYYLFIKKDHPLGAKYGVLQKFAYVLTIPLTYFMAYTGFCLYAPTQDLPVFTAGLEWIGGPINMRILHYMLMWVFIIFTAIHAYLASIDGAAPLRLMFAGKETEGLQFDPKTGDMVGGDSH